MYADEVPGENKISRNNKFPEKLS